MATTTTSILPTVSTGFIVLTITARSFTTVGITVPTIRSILILDGIPGIMAVGVILIAPMAIIHHSPSDLADIGAEVTEVITIPITEVITMVITMGITAATTVEAVVSPATIRWPEEDQLI